jgi:sterol-4alpha-carboxylate 3-dehydrogenase (decarboxylating)
MLLILFLKSWLVIGGCGFLGRNIVDQLLARGEKKVAVFDLRQTFEDSRVEFFIGDLTKLEDVKKATDGKTVVIHTASPHPGAPNKVQFAVNVDGTNNVIEACVANKVRKLVYTSSASVIFNGQPLVNADESYPYCEVHMDVYNETKVSYHQLSIFDT